MANLQQYRTHESLNVDTAAVWDEQTKLDISSAAERSADVSDYGQVALWSDLEIYFTFDSDSGTSSISTANSLRIPASTLVYMKVPKGVGSTIYLHVKATSSASTKYCRLVKM